MNDFSLGFAMKELFFNRIIPMLAVVALLLISGFAVHQTIQKNKIEAELTASQNQLAEAIGTIEVKEGLYVRLASEHDNLNRRYESLLGDNERLSEVINTKEEEIRALTQLNASLREDIVFAGNATTTVLTSCNDVTNSNQNVSITTDTGREIDPDETVPNIRVDFDLQEEGFRVQGFTESNPSLLPGPPSGRAELTLTQTDPFVIDIALTENEDNDWRAIVYEQQNRLEFDVGVLSVNPQSDRLKWFERIGVGAQAAVTESSAGIAPTLSMRLGHSGAWSVDAGPYWDLSRDGTVRGATVGITMYPFDRGRRK